MQTHSSKQARATSAGDSAAVAERVVFLFPLSPPPAPPPPPPLFPFPLVPFELLALAASAASLAAPEVFPSVSFETPHTEKGNRAKLELRMVDHSKSLQTRFLNPHRCQCR